jgi:hypothetical protein
MMIEQVVYIKKTDYTKFLAHIGCVPAKEDAVVRYPKIIDHQFFWCLDMQRNFRVMVRQNKNGINIVALRVKTYSIGCFILLYREIFPIANSPSPIVGTMLTLTDKAAYQQQKK